MPAGDIEHRATMDSTQLENALAKIEGKYAQLKEQMGAAARESKRGHEGIEASISGSVEGLARMAAGYLTVQAAVGFVKQAHSDYAETLDRVHEKLERINQDLLVQSSRMGLAAQSQEIRDWSRKIVQAGEVPATREQVQSTFFAVAGAAPTTSMERRKELTTQALKAVPMYGEKKEEVAKFAAATGRLAEFMPEKTSDDLADLVTSARKRVGADAEELTGREFLGGVRMLTESGASSPEGAMALGITAIRKQMSPQIVARIAAKVNENIAEPVVPHGKAPTREQQLKAKFARASKPERLRMVLDDAEMQSVILGQRLAGRLGTIDSREVDRTAAELVNEQSANIFQSELAASAQTEAGADFQGKAEMSRREDVIDMMKEPAADRRAEKKRRYFAAIDERNRSWGAKVAQKASYYALQFFEDTLPWDAGLTTSEVGRMEALNQQKPDQLTPGIKPVAKAVESIDRNIRTGQATGAALNAKGGQGEGAP